MARVLIAPDSFKGSLPATDVAQAIARGWSSVRPDDELVLIPMADGGEGTLDAFATAHPEATWHHDTVTGPDGNPVEASWLMLTNGTAVLELAQSSGLPLMTTPDPLGATTRGLGELMAIAAAHGANHLVIGLGGSATTDAGIGALEALGLKVTREGSHPRGVVGITDLVTPEAFATGVAPITLLTDTTAVMTEAPRVFAPQKGATPDQVTTLERAFDRLILLARDTETHQIPGSGAAGATAWGLCHFLDAQITAGARSMATLLGLDQQVRDADYAIAGEGRFDITSMGGKVVGHIVTRAESAGTSIGLIVGDSENSFPHGQMVRLVDIAPTRQEAISGAGDFVERCAAELASGWSSGTPPAQR